MAQEYGNEEWRKLKDVPRGHLLDNILGSTKLEKKVRGNLEDQYIDLNNQDIRGIYIREIMRITGVKKSTATYRLNRYIEGKMGKKELLEKVRIQTNSWRLKLIPDIMEQTGCKYETVLKRLEKYDIRKIDCDKLWEPVNKKFRKVEII